MLIPIVVLVAGVAAATEARTLQGEWRGTAAEVEGVALPGDLAAGLRVTITGGVLKFRFRDELHDNRLTLDPGGAAGMFDVETLDGQGKGVRAHGIYKREGDRLTLCLPIVPGQVRPVSFATKPNDGLMLLVLEKATAGK